MGGCAVWRPGSDHMAGSPGKGGAGVRAVMFWTHRLFRAGRIYLGLAALAWPLAVAGRPSADSRGDLPAPGGRAGRVRTGGAVVLALRALRAEARAPVVVLNHGWLAVNPGAYGAWIDHLVRSGNVVIFPRYQADALTLPIDFLPNALNAVSDAFDVLEMARGHVRPDRDRFALIGHSAGGNLAAQMAAMAAERGCRSPRAVIAMMPGEVVPSREPDLSAIPAETLLVVAVAEEDFVVGDLRPRDLRPGQRHPGVAEEVRVLPQRPPRHTAADRRSPRAHGRLPAVRHRRRPLPRLPDEPGRGQRAGPPGFWRLADLTLQAAFAGRTLDEATNHGELFRHLGYWSDGRPVAQPVRGRRPGDDAPRLPRQRRPPHPLAPRPPLRPLPRTPPCPGPGPARRRPARPPPHRRGRPPTGAAEPGRGGGG